MIIVTGAVVGMVIPTTSTTPSGYMMIIVIWPRTNIVAVKIVCITHSLPPPIDVVVNEPTKFHLLVRIPL